jgi:hypothetical protein
MVNDTLTLDLAAGVAGMGLQRMMGVFAAMAKSLLDSSRDPPLVAILHHSPKT